MDRNSAAAGAGAVQKGIYGLRGRGWKRPGTKQRGAGTSLVGGLTKGERRHERTSSFRANGRDGVLTLPRGACGAGEQSEREQHLSLFVVFFHLGRTHL